MGTDGPELCLDLADRMVITKPPGWEVYGQSQLQLLSFIQAVIGARPIHQNLEDACGFVHRLDIPSSGLILSAKTHAAYYDLQLQLVSGSILRDYLVLCHGCVSFQRHKVSARLSLIQNTTRAGGQGEPSRTLLKLMSYLSHGSDSFSLLLARILTGRRHQIRSHFAFLGHPSLCDSRRETNHRLVCSFVGSRVPLAFGALFSPVLNFGSSSMKLQGSTCCSLGLGSPVNDQIWLLDPRMTQIG
ncbi:unnamed protein product [Effrenium voratum]|nr:unnamed protein product [Effrenium voratum]